MYKPWLLIPSLALWAACGGSGGSNPDGADLPTTPPTRIELLAAGGFHNAGAVAASPTGTLVYAAAYTAEDEPAIFVVDATDGDVEVLYRGAPLLYPSDLAMSCEGDDIFVSDLGTAVAADEESGDLEAVPPPVDGAIHVVAADGTGVSQLEVSGLGRASGIAMSVDCTTLYVSGATAAGQPAVFKVPVEGGAPTVLFEGAPLVSPTGIHVDANAVAWVMDHAARDEGGEGMLFAIDDAGEIGPVASGLDMGRHGGVSLTPGGVTAVIPVDDFFAGPQIITANTQTGEFATMETPDITHPTGVAAATNAPVMVIAGENSIHIARFD